MVCLYCKKEFDSNFYNVRKGFGKHCSKKCSNLANGFGFKNGHKDYSTEESREKLADCSRTRKREPFSEESKKKMSEAQKKHWDKVGRKRCGGKRRRKCYKCIEWRMRVFERDNYTCQSCGTYGVYLEAHHKKAWIAFPRLRHELANGIALCHICHSKTDNYKKKALKELI